MNKEEKETEPKKPRKELKVLARNRIIPCIDDVWRAHAENA